MGVAWRDWSGEVCWCGAVWRERCGVTNEARCAWKRRGEEAWRGAVGRCGVMSGAV